MMECQYLVAIGPGATAECGRAAAFVVNGRRPVCVRHVARALQLVTERGEAARVEAVK